MVHQTPMNKSMRKFLDVHDAHCCKIHGCKYNDEKCTVVNGACEGVECEDCEPYVSYYVNDSSIKYKLSYTQWYAVDHLSVDSDNYHQYFNTVEEALEEYKKLKAKNTSKDWPRNNFKLIEYREIKIK